MPNLNPIASIVGGVSGLDSAFAAALCGGTGSIDDCIIEEIGGYFQGYSADDVTSLN